MNTPLESLVIPSKQGGTIKFVLPEGSFYTDPGHGFTGIILRDCNTKKGGEERKVRIEVPEKSVLRSPGQAFPDEKKGIFVYDKQGALIAAKDETFQHDGWLEETFNMIQPHLPASANVTASEIDLESSPRSTKMPPVSVTKPDKGPQLSVTAPPPPEFPR